MKLIDPKSLFQKPEDRRVLSETQQAADPALTAEGWELRFIADAERMSEVSELYADIGYEVRAEPVRVTHDQVADDCAPCATTMLNVFSIYTRKSRTPNS
jgi:hypothetical protein